MKMTILDFINLCDRNDYDVDICSDYTDFLQVNYVGNNSVTFTDVGLCRFKKTLSLEIDYDDGSNEAVVLIPEDTEAEMDEYEYEVGRLFKALAGYCSVDNFDTWFKSCDE
jgi:hypothetical protein